MSSLPVRNPLRGLYAITPDDGDTGRLVTRVRTVVETGIACLQYRNKTATAGLRAEQAVALLALCGEHGVPLVINDDVRLAKELEAGVHLGGGDGDIAEARALLGADAIIGASCYDSIERARQAATAGATYVAFGAFFPSTTKPHARRAHPGLLTEAAMLGLPRVAIGGIDPENAPALVAAGADMLAVIGALFDAPDPAGVARRLSRLFKDIP